MQIIKRDGQVANFNKEKIYDAIMKAMTFGSGLVKQKVAEDIADEIENEAKECSNLDVYRVESMVFDKLIAKGETLTAKAYEGYRRVREFQRNVKNSTDKSTMELLEGNSDYWNHENSNKNAMLVTTQRDYMAGIASTDISMRKLLPPDIIQAHEDGILHFHDMDYFGQNALHNCCLINLEDMLQNGTVISGVMIEKPHSFSTACNVATQIIAQVASSQYGGQSITLTHLAPFVDVSRQKIRKKTIEWVENTYQEIRNKPFKYSKYKIVSFLQRKTNAEEHYRRKSIKMAEQFKQNINVEKMVEADVLEDIRRGIQTIQY